MKTEPKFKVGLEANRVIPSYSNYIATKDGKIFSLITGKEISQYLSIHGYLRVSVRKNKKPRMIFVHRLVCEAFIGEIPDGKQVDHIDGNRSNNTLENLRYVTAKENNRRRLEMGTLPHGERHPKTKLTYEQVSDIKNSYMVYGAQKTNSRELAKKYGVVKSTIVNILSGRSWKYHGK